MRTIQFPENRVAWTRVFFDSIDKAVDWRHKWGGWIAWENNVERDLAKVYWYGLGYTPTLIINDLPRGESYTIQ